MNSTCKKQSKCLPGGPTFLVFATVLVVVKALTMMRLFLKEQMMLNFRDAEQDEGC